MIQDVIFSIGVALPIFLVITVGHILRRIGFVDQEFIRRANRIILYVALPMKLFNDVRTVDLNELSDLRFFAFAAAAIFCSFIFVWIFSYVVGIKEEQKASFVQGSFRGNFLYMGFSIIENIFGNLGAKPPMILAMIIFLYNFLAIFIFTLYRQEKMSKESLARALGSFAKNPMIIAIGFGLAASLIQLSIPDFASKTIGYFQALATPLALLSIGATFDFKKMGARVKATAWATLLKLVILPLLAVGAGMLLGFGGRDLVTLYVLFGVPTATISFIIASALDGDGELASSIIMSTTLFSIPTITLFVFGFKSLGII